jgi:hypothetical protein
MRKQHSWASQDNMDGLFWEVQGSELQQTHMDIEHTLSLCVCVSEVPRVAIVRSNEASQQQTTST